MVISVIITIILTLAFNVVLIWKNKGTPQYLSDSFKIFGGTPKGYIFHWYILILFGLLIYPVMKVTPDNLAFLPFIALGFTVFVGSTVNTKLSGSLHLICAYISCVLMIVWSLLMGCWQLVVIISVISSIIAYIDRKAFIYWLEMGCIFLSLLTTLTLVLLTI